MCAYVCMIEHIYTLYVCVCVCTYRWGLHVLFSLPWTCVEFVNVPGVMFHENVNGSTVLNHIISGTEFQWISVWQFCVVLDLGLKPFDRPWHRSDLRKARGRSEVQRRRCKKWRTFWVAQPVEEKQPAMYLTIDMLIMFDIYIYILRYLMHWVVNQHTWLMLH